MADINVLKNLDPNETVFPQDVPLGTPDGKCVRYGGLTKHEHFTLALLQGVISRAGLPPTPMAAEDTVRGCVLLAWATLGTLKDFKPPSPDTETKPHLYGVS